MTDELAEKIIQCKIIAMQRNLFRTMHILDDATKVLCEELDPNYKADYWKSKEAERNGE